jgi:D-alanyl-D-alanine carboxypeptidase
VKDDGRLIVGVVMGGKTGRARDNQMAALIHTYLPKASRRGGGDLVAKADGDSSPVSAIAKVLLPKHDAPTPDKRPKPVAVAADDTARSDTSIDTADAKAATVAAYAESQQVDPLATASVAKGAWVVQVASSPRQAEAKAFLDKASRQAPHVLADASSFTVAFDNDGTTYYRARFGGFKSQNAALKACHALKRKKIDCYAVQQ